MKAADIEKLLNERTARQRRRWSRVYGCLIIVLSLVLFILLGFYA